MNRIWLSAVLPISSFVVPVQPAEATFDHMQIEQVIGGVNGDTTAQAIQLRMRSSFQGSVSFARLRVWDAQGLNPMVVINFGQNVALAGCGRRVLITSPNFNSLTTPIAIPNFTMTNLIPASYLAAGSITFETNTGSVIYWRLSWGGANYTGSNAGSCTNDDSICPGPGDFGPPWPDPLPSGGCQALQFQGACNALSTTNADDYALTNRAAVFTNNANISFTVSVTPCCGNGVPEPGEDCTNCPADVTCRPGTECIAGVCEPLPNTADISGPLGPGFPDGCVDAFDLGTLLGAWCSAASDPDPPDDVDPPCEGCTSPNFALADIAGPGSPPNNPPDGCVDAFDLGKLLANWCSVAGGNPCGTCQ
ncbi:MAG: hypothetical protein O7F17_05450 [Planctomycetota bacterium]|nr:hypothetical protein [Planctomycetota bacterium]